jgi:16S rRNA U516 pseudouridylate synthase RsuA-like enzyme
MTCAAASKLRLDKLLANLGYCGRRDSGQYIRARKVFVKGVRALSGALKVDPGDVEVDGKNMLQLSKMCRISTSLFRFRLPSYVCTSSNIMLHKPSGIVCSTQRDTPDSRIVSDLLPVWTSFLIIFLLLFHHRFDRKRWLRGNHLS